MQKPTKHPHGCLALNALVIDDHSSSALLIKSLLDTLAIQHIDTALNCQNAIEQCQSRYYDLLLIDFHLDNNINGSELLAILREERWISINTAVIIISSDPTQTVLLTSLESEPDAFLSKPFNRDQLEKKVTQTLKDCQLRKPIYDALQKYKLKTAVQLCQQQLSHTGHNYKLENLLLDLLIASQDWEMVAQTLESLKTTHPSHKVTLLEARLLHYQGKTELAIETLRSLITEAPLCAHAYDMLSHYLQGEEEYHQALIIAARVSTLTPAICYRTLHVAQLAVHLNQPQTLLKAGRTLVLNFPLMGKEWLKRFLQFIAFYEQWDPNYQDPQGQKELTLFYQLAEQRLPINQHSTFNTLHGLLLARMALKHQQSFEAKSFLFQGLKHFYKKWHTLPLLLIFEIIPVLIQLGERHLLKIFNQQIALQQPLSEEHQPHFQRLQSNTTAILQSRQWAQDLDNAAQQVIQDSKEALFTYQTLRIRHPHSSDALLGQLTALVTYQHWEPMIIKEILSQLNALPLLPEHSQQRETLQIQVHELAKKNHQSLPVFQSLPTD